MFGYDFFGTEKEYGFSSDMTIQYTYRSGWCIVFVYLCLMMFLPIGYLFILARSASAGIAVFYCGMMAVMVIGGLILDHIPVKIVADPSYLRIKKLFRTKQIDYYEIAEIQVAQEHRKPEFRGDGRCYIETMKIVLKDGSTIDLEKNLNINLEEMILKPDELKEALKNTDFQKLNDYINRWR